MGKVWYIPLEHLDKRYTILMDKQIVKELKYVGLEYERIYGNELTDEIETGFFLDAIGTNYFKFSQLMKIMRLFKNRKIKDGDIFFFSDLWFPGIEAIPYTASFMKLKIKITGIMHAGSWTETDDVRTLMKEWAKDIEKGWFKFIDIVFLGSNHHKSEIVMRGRTLDINKLKVSGLAFSSKEILSIAPSLPWEERDNVIVFPHRLHWEKQPEVFDTFMKTVPEFTAFKTMEHNLSKADYFKVLGKSKFAFSSALQENFGYSMLEAWILGCIPIVPDRLSYVEFFDKEFRYNNIEDATNIVHKFKHKGVQVRDLTHWDLGVRKMIIKIKDMMENGNNRS